LGVDLEYRNFTNKSGDLPTNKCKLTNEKGDLAYKKGYLTNKSGVFPTKHGDLRNRGDFLESPFSAQSQ